jgi:stage II sporulation protein D
LPSLIGPRMSRRIAITAVLAALVSLVPASGAWADFDFYGSGYGHGIGLSQYGALGLAHQGWEGPRIVEYYFHNTNVGPRNPPNPEIKVGLLQNRSAVKLVASAGSFDLRLKSGRLVDTVEAGQSRTVTVQSGQYRVKRPSGEPVGGPVGGTGNHMMAVRNGGRIGVPDWGHQVSRGYLQFDIVNATQAHLVAVLPVEHYLFGVSEVSTSWHIEAQMAQAIMARSYGYWRLAGAPRSGCSCDLFGTSRDQVYTGWSKESSTGGERWLSAINQTSNEVVTYNGNYVYTPYSSSSGGHTESIENVWPAAAPAPWLKGVCDPYDDVGSNPGTSWKVSFSPGQVTNALGLGIGMVRHFTNYDRGVSGRVTNVRVLGSSGSRVVRGLDIRRELGLKDTRFSVNRNLNITGLIRAKYDQEDCAPGRAEGPKQEIRGGAYQRFVHGRIYRNAAAGRQVWVRGAVLNKYRAEGAHAGPLGLPLNYMRISGGTKGVFDRGTIVCTGGCSVRYG